MIKNRVREGSLPLQQFALTQLWTKQRPGLLTHQVYEDIGGVTQAIANLAEAAHTDGIMTCWNFDIDDLLKKGCDHLHDYLQNNPNVNPEDKRLCDST
ncbi:MAG: hypothetical protein PUP91_36780 [Rhizonema sp. PD37]|nr:hypothetical protein [Rhizonema sp. PD37]